MTGVMSRVAGAPISWGVCEVPDWGHQTGRDRVLTEMRNLGLVATEFGPDGFLPKAPNERSALLASYGLAAVGGFVPTILHDPARDVLADLEGAFQGFTQAQARVVVLAADSGRVDYDSRIVLDDDQWKTLCGNLDRIAQAAADRGLTATLHPHVGTLVERSQDIERVLEGSTIALCLDTGHLLIGGVDPAELAAAAPDRIAHAHLKDVDGAWADRVRTGDITYSAAVRAGMYRPLGRGDVDIAGIVRGLEATGYQGWYVMEQDTVLGAEPAAGQGPIADVQASLAFLEGLAA